MSDFENWYRIVKSVVIFTKKCKVMSVHPLMIRENAAMLSSKDIRVAFKQLLPQF